MCYQAQFKCPIPKVLGICQGCEGKNDACKNIADAIFTDQANARAVRQSVDSVDQKITVPANITKKKNNLGVGKLIICTPANKGTMCITRRCIPTGTVRKRK
jgi:hypothetical protein